jgi:redox-sensitive bicupin YhaK (pirin superfamily)
MIDIRPFASLGAAQHGWLDAHHHFSFANYHDPHRKGWGSIRVWNDDTIAPGTGFPPHSHANMEIITYVRSGAITHTDSMGHEGRTEAGDVQVMSAGTGVQHAEYNREEVPTTLFQIWVHPRAAGGAPGWGAKPFPKDARTGSWAVLASGFAGDDDALKINADARVLGATLAVGASLAHIVEDGRYAYLVPATGRITVNGVEAQARDGVALTGGDYTITALDEAELVLVDAP